MILSLSSGVSLRSFFLCVWFSGWGPVSLAGALPALVGLACHRLVLDSACIFSFSCFSLVSLCEGPGVRFLFLVFPLLPFFDGIFCAGRPSVLWPGPVSFLCLLWSAGFLLPIFFFLPLLCLARTGASFFPFVLLFPALLHIPLCGSSPFCLRVRRVLSPWLSFSLRPLPAVPAVVPVGL